MDTKHTITTKYLGPTNTKPARISCYCTLGEQRKVYPYEHSAVCAHEIAAKLMLGQINYSQLPQRAPWTIIAKGMLNAKEYVFTLDV